MTKDIITQEKLKELLHYCKNTGVFTRKVSLNNRWKVGQVSGRKNNRGYIDIRVQGILYQAHRLAWLYVYGEWPKNDIDHINQVRDSNNIDNLRDVTRKDNGRNQKKHITNTSGVMGVGWMNDRKKWRSRIFNGKEDHLGFFTEKWDAICARKSAEVKYKYHENHGLNHA